MTRAASSDTVASLLSRFQTDCKAYQQALRREDVPAANRLLLSIMRRGDALADSEAGRAALEALLDHPNAMLRLRTAHSSLTWAAEKTIPVVGRLLIGDLGAESGALERIMIRTSACDKLYLSFGIRSWRQNDLIAPLRAYGIELPYDEEEIST